MKVYQVIIQDEWNNLYHLGFYADLKDSIEDINSWLESYNVKIDDLQEYAGSFDTCFDKEIEVDDSYVYVRGFILNGECTDEKVLIFKD